MGRKWKENGKKMEISSDYLGRTRAGISVALRKIRPDTSLCETYVIYDGSMGRVDKVKSMYRYNK